MEIFLDTANIDEINEIIRWGIIKGVTTNQKIFLKEKGCNFEEQSKRILKMVEPHPVSLEGPNDLDELLETAKEYSQWGKNVVIKVPMLPNGDGIKAAKILENQGIKTNVTAMMNLNQAFLAMAAGASYASLFFNRIRDYGDDPVQIVKQARTAIDEGGYKTKLIVGSIRKPEDVADIITTNAHVITIPYKILKQMPYHEKT
ncbi:MAG: fructose-6-phosphate aldolase, partial [Thermoplasmatales archaeon]